MEALTGALLTYLLHSTLLLLGAALLGAVWGGRRLALQEAVLRAALVGGFLTTGLQLGLGLSPVAGVVRMSDAADTGAAADPGSRAVRSTPSASPSRSARRARVGPALPAHRLAAEAPGDAIGARWTARVVPAPSPLGSLAERARAGGRRAASLVGGWGESLARNWKQTMALAWGALSLLALTRLGVAALRLTRLLRDRRPLRADALVRRVVAVATRLGLGRAVRLSDAPRLQVPLATGVLRPEVCLPTRAVVELAADEQVALCAHELAHLARRDPAWILLAHLVEAAAPLQPLNVWARRRLQDIAECLSDDMAVTASASPLGLARSLVDVAGWTLGGRKLLPLAAGAFVSRSRLGQRVERLMDPVRAVERPRRLVFPVAILAVLATAMLSPVVSGGAAPGTRGDDAATVTSAPSPPEVAPAPPAPPARPAPAARPAPPAPAVPAAPAARPAPAPRPAPPAPAPVASDDAETRIEQLSEAIAQRVQVHEDEMKQLEQKIEKLASRITPDEKELERLSQAIGEAAGELATAVTEGIDAGRDAARSERARAAARRMAELQEQLKEATKDIRLPEAELRALTERARELAEQVKPTPAEVEELRRLSEKVAATALAALPAEEIVRLKGEAREQAREAVQSLKAELRRVREEVKRERDGLESQREELRRQREEIRQQKEELRRQKEELKQQQEERRRQGEAEPSARNQRARAAALTATASVIVAGR